MSDDIPMVPGSHACGITKCVGSWGIPFTKLRIELVRVILDDALEDEVRKELIMLGLLKEKKSGEGK